MNSPIHSETSIGIIHLTVADLARSLHFYQNSIGFALRYGKDDSVTLGNGTNDLLVVTEQRGARAVKGITGLYHFALLVPSRLELAKSLHRLIKTKTPLSGFSDHGVSEAIYLSDPDGHGIEIYRDRSRQEWPYENGRLAMTTERMDVEGVLAELDSPDNIGEGLSPKSRMGHIHLHVADLDAAKRFYVDVLGFELVARYGPSALFVAAGGYHHHIGLNTWAGIGAPLPPPDAVAMQLFEIHLPNETALLEVNQRVQDAGIASTKDMESLSVIDPSGNRIILTSRNRNQKD